MKIYLAAPYSLKDLMTQYATELRAAGIVVTSSWLEETHKPTIQMHELTSAEHREYAMRDVRDVQAADIFVLQSDTTKSVIRAGRHVEFGMAVQRKMPIFVIGEEYENIFHHLPGVEHVKVWSELRDFLIASANS